MRLRVGRAKVAPVGGQTSAGAAPSLVVGRGSEIEQVRAAAEGASADDPATVLVITGEPGIGKSTLLRHALHEVRDELATQVIALRGDETEAELDYGLVDQLLRAVGWNPVEGRMAASAISPPEVGARLLQATDALDADRLLVVAVDDAHLVDDLSLQALTFVARRAAGDRLALVLACRPVGLRRLPAGLLRIAADTGGTIELGGLDEAELAELARVAYGRPVPSDAAARLHDHTGGRPLHALLLLQQVGLDELTGADPASLPALPPLIVEQLVSCSPPARQLLEALSVLRQPSLVGEVAALAELDDPLLAVDELAALGLVEEAPGETSLRIVVSHDLTRTAVYQSISAGRRAQLHQRAAAVTAGTEALHHRVAAAVEPAADLVADLVHAARAEVGRGARHQAARLLLTAAELAPTGERDDLLLDAAHHLLVIGQPIGEHLPAIEALGETPRRGVALGRIRMAEGRLHEARTLLEAAWAAGGEATLPPEERAAAAEALAVIGISTLDTDAVIRWSDELGAAGPTTLATTLRCHGLTLRGQLGTALDEAAALVAAEPPGSVDFDARVGLGLLLVWSNQVEEGLPLLSSLLTGPSDQTLMQTLSVRSHLADAHLRLGNLQHAMDLAALAVELLDDAEARWLTPLPHSLVAYACAATGDLARAERHAQAASAYARLSHDAPALLWSDAGWMRIAEAAQDHAAAVAVGDRMLAAGLDGVAEGINPWRASYAAALAVEGRLADADAVLAAVSTDDVSVATGVARARAIVAVERGDRAGAEAALDHGLALDPLLARPLPRARLELTAGGILRRHGQRRRAEALLVAAAERFRDVGAHLWLARCERELEGTGLRPAKRSTRLAAAALTHQERLVAGLVVEGRTNREVAEELYVSAKTVEHHLSRIYRKLGVGSRTQLAARARELGLEP